MPKILIFGNSGSGKSTMAKHLAETQQLAHFDLDTIAWRDTDPPARAPVSESQKVLDKFFAEYTAWVIEGCYADLINVALPYATDIIFMNLDAATCMANARQRPWEPHKYSSKEAQDQNLEMLLNWIAGYYIRSDELSLQAHRSVYDQFQGSKVMYTRNPDIA